MDSRRLRMIARLLRIWRDKQSHHALMVATYGPKHYETDEARYAEAEARADVLDEIG